MFGIDDPSAVPTPPTPEPAGTAGFWSEGNPALGQRATLMRASFFNGLQQELLNILAAAGITPSKTTYNQLLKAIQAISNSATSGSLRFPVGDTQDSVLPNAAGRANRIVGFDAIGNVLTLAAPAAPPANIVTYGGITGTGNNPIKIGWNSGISRLAVQVDSNSFSNTWPIDITGSAAHATDAAGVNNITGWGYSAVGGTPTYLWCSFGSNNQQLVEPRLITVGHASSADSATNANNANAVDGIGGWAYRNDGNNPAYLWCTEGNGQAQHLTQPGALSVNYANRADSARTADTFQGSGPGYWINNASTALVNIRNNGAIQLIAGISGFGDVWWPVNISDERLKKDIAPTEADSLADIEHIEFVEYRYRDDVTEIPIDDGRLHSLGVISQQLQAVDPEWVSDTGTYLQPDGSKLLFVGLHAIQQLDRKMRQRLARMDAVTEALAARLATLEGRR